MTVPMSAPVTARPARRGDLAGVAWMLATGLAFVSLNGIVRYIGPGLPAGEQAFLRFAFGLVFLAPTLALTLRRGFAPRVWRLFGLRGALHAAASLLWFFAMTRIPLAEVTAIGYLNPVVVMVGAALLMGERLSRARLLAVAVALVGAMILLRPGLRELQSGHAAQVTASVLFALSYLVAKRLSGLVSPGAIVAMMTLAVTLALAPLALWHWVTPTPSQAGLLALAAVLGSLGHYCMTRAFAAAPLAVTQPVTFLQLVWATALGVVAFGDPLDPWVLLGGGVMIAAISAVTWAESRPR